MRILLTIILFMFTGSHPQCAPGIRCNFTPYVPVWYNADFSEIMLKMALYDLVEHPHIVYAQAILETGNFTSAIFLENNNLFGMKHPRQRETLSLGHNRGHAKYKSWQDSVRDYAKWQEYYKSHGYDISNYDIYLKKFNHHHDYINKIQKLCANSLAL